jgi:hypothetical protein
MEIYLSLKEVGTMLKTKRVIFGLVFTSLFFTGTGFAYADDSLVNTPNADFNDIGNALVSSGYTQTNAPNGDVFVGNPGDPLASYSGETGNWVYYHE